MGTGSYNIIPEGENHCVWMDAGLVNYKLCDKNFDCESCPFDRTMRMQHHPFSERAVVQSDIDAQHVVAHDVSEKIFVNVINHLIDPLKKIRLPEDRLYFSNHTWIQKLADGKCKIGVNTFLGNLLQPVMGAVVITPPSRIEKDSPFAWFIRDDETFTIHSSIPGIAVEVNNALSSKPALVTKDPYGEGWLLTITPQSECNEVSRFYTAEEFRVRMSHDIHKVEALLNSTLNKQRKEIGTTMFDGGVRIETIEQFIGERRYTQLLSRLLRPHSR